MRFIRKGGHIIPIRDKREDHSARNATAVGATVGAAHHAHEGYKAAQLDKLAKNHRSLTKFAAHLAPGDILVMGSTAKNSGGHEVGSLIGALPKGLRKHAAAGAKAIGLKQNATVLSNSTLLTSVGAGSKYHAAVYMGKGKIAHMSTDGGAVIEHIRDAAEKQNITALRFSNASKSEAASAVAFAKKAAQKKVPYQATGGVTSAFSNLVAPLGKKQSQEFSSMVCHTLPIRAWSKRTFSLGEHTFSGDLIRTKGIAAVARHDVVKSSSLAFRAIAGNAAKGLKWGAALGLGVAAFNYVKGKRAENGR